MHLPYPRCTRPPLAAMAVFARLLVPSASLMKRPRSYYCLLVAASVCSAAGTLPGPLLLMELAAAAGWLLLILSLPLLLLLLLLLVASARISAARSFIISIYCRMPLNSLSRAWGRCHRRPLPRRARAPLYRLYSHLYSCDLSEVRCDRLADFASLAEFFSRDLRPGLRPICPASELVSPADGRVLSLGLVRAGHLEQVKGVTYSLQGFLGPQPFADCSNGDAIGDASDAPVSPLETPVPDAAYRNRLRRRPGTELFHCAIYLAPGDYHKFHSPADWIARARRHFPGRLLSVAPPVAARVAGLFCINERAAYTGVWRHGFMCVAAVGATGVGSISVPCDPDLATNLGGRRAAYYDKSLAPGSPHAKGQLFGEFNLGSTIVLLFEAPSSFDFAARPGQRIRVGESLGTVGT